MEIRKYCIGSVCHPLKNWEELFGISSKLLAERMRRKNLSLIEAICYVNPDEYEMLGETFGQLTVLKKGKGHISQCGKKTATWICECSCGNTTEKIGNNLRRGHVRSCGCISGQMRVESSGSHGKTNHYLHKTWSGIKTRCFNSRDKSYKHYGGRGITMFEGWIDNFQAFYEYIINNLGERPNKHTLDRIDVEGNYEPGNIRWATSTIQSINRRRTSTKVSGRIGVNWCKRSNKWKVHISIKNQYIHLGYFDNKEDAIATRLAAEIKHHNINNLLEA